MVFSSTIFLFCFFPIVLALYYIPSWIVEKIQGGVLVSNKITEYKNIILLIASIIFYAYGEGVLVILILFCIIANYIFGLLVSKENISLSMRNVFLAIAIIVDLSVLFVYKYLDFVISNINAILKTSIPYTHLTLPIGISFFTFQAISYVIDVYRKKAKAQTNPLKVGLYIALFPQLVAGPIVRYESIALQMDSRTESLDKMSRGVVRFLTGICKKVLLADTMAIFADRIFTYQSGWNDMTVAFAWLGAIAYTLQIYYDFAGYSDMAIGLGLIFGFEFEENFNYPYMAKSISDFWRRWHISLATWFRDYVYIPLGGSRKGTAMHIRNICIVWFLTGFWHGASWNYIMWGVYSGIFLILEKYLIGKYIEKLPGALQHIYAMVIILFSMVIFKTPTLYMAAFYLAQMVGIKTVGLCDATVWLYIRDNWMFFVPAILFATPIGKKLEKVPWLHSVLLFLAFLMAVLYILKGSYSPFIYFHF